MVFRNSEYRQHEILFMVYGLRGRIEDGESCELGTWSMSIFINTQVNTYNLYMISIVKNKFISYLFPGNFVQI